MTSPALAIVGMACRYPDADSPAELWENVLAQRRAFRRMPPERLRREDYFSTDVHAPDRTYSAEAALLEGYEFDRVRFRVAGSTFRSADLAHWLALEVAADALEDAGFREGEGLSRESTGVLLGNTLTGEFSRANVMRLRWPYVRRVVESALLEEGWAPEQRRAILQRLEAGYKAPFPPIGEESLAGGLSNTIAGRICNHFDLKGGGYTTDGACASSLLAVASACSALAAGDIDVALAGGVDLSLDPFELVGFAKTGALAPEEMRIYDSRSAGFWPGEGCGFVVLMRHEDAVASGRRVYATVRGWGVSSDGSGGITRPEFDGQLLALRRAYRRAGFGAETVAYFEGHGTGTSVGDATELRVLSRARLEGSSGQAPAAIGSIKANIGHTKAAAGIAGLIKATAALHAQILPPTTGCEMPHPELTGESPALKVLSEGEPWPSDSPLRAGVSAMGFGGINTHVVLEGPDTERRKAFHARERLLVSSAQDAELLLLGARDTIELLRQVDHLLTFASGLSRAEVADLAAQRAATLDDHLVRAALVASGPAELVNRLETLKSWLANGVTKRLDVHAGVFLSEGANTPRVGFLFPGQGSPAHFDGGALRRRFESARKLYEGANLAATGDGIATEVAQPAIVTASIAALLILNELGITARVAVGHSLGELTALHWAGAFDGEALLRIASARGKAMAELGNPTGAMASIGAGCQDVEVLLNGEPVSIAGLNSPRQTVVSGEKAAVAAVADRARSQGLRAVNLPVSHAFHSPLVEAAIPALAEQLSREELRPLRHAVVSTITGGRLTNDEDLRALLCRQVTSTVRFAEAVSETVEEVDLFIEAGPGRVLSGLVAESVDTPAVPVDAGGPSLRGLLLAVGAAFALGAPVKHGALFAGRFTRPFDLDWNPRFLANPCELAPTPDDSARDVDAQATTDTEIRDQPHAEPATDSPVEAADASPLELVRRLVAERAELPPSAVEDEDRMLSDLHLNSIAVGELVAEAARSLGLTPLPAPNDYADAAVAEVARALEELASTSDSVPAEEADRLPAGVDSWTRTFTVELVECSLPRRHPPVGTGIWHVLGVPDDPLVRSLQQAFADSDAGGGVVVCLPPDADERHLALLLEGARAVLAEKEASQFVLVQRGGGAAAFARTLHLEAPKVKTCVVDVPVDHPRAAEWVLAEASASIGYSEAHYDESGRRREPVLRLLSDPGDPVESPLGPDDVLLVTGGGKGIAAECALTLAQETGIRLALLGRSRPEADAELAANLDRFVAAGLDYRYVVADITDAGAVLAATREVEAELGPITGILHGAGRNVPQLLSSLDEPAFLRTLAPKVQGTRNVLAAVDADRLRLFVTFGSIIARTGLPGEADYGLANEWLTRLTERYQAEHPNCRCLAVEWSVWSGVGMGERLGRVGALVRQGITPIPPDEGVSVLRRLIARPSPAVSVVVTGRYGEAPTLTIEQQELPFLRFLERPRVQFPGVELVVDAELSADADPYLDDHSFRGERLLPAVMALEAMAQAAMAVTGAADPPDFEDVTFDRPVVLPDGESATIRVAALVREPGLVEVVLRSEKTAFQMNHFRAVCRFGRRESYIEDLPTDLVGPESKPSYVPLDVDDGLYCGILFQEGRFRRLRGYRQLRATECVAEITPGGETDWFGRYLPQQLVLGDPGARDASIHAIQACIPHAPLLPIGVDRLVLGSAQTQGPWLMHARERSREEDLFIYDVEVTGLDGRLRERWEGLRLRMVGGAAVRGPWAGALLGPYVERQLQDLIPGSAVAVAVEQANTERRSRSDRAIRRALGKEITTRRRSDGKPWVADGLNVSAAHCGDLTLAVAGHGPLACDAETVVVRPDRVWGDLLGPDRLALAKVIAEEAGEEKAVAETRVWAATECLKKAGTMLDAPLVLTSSTADGWVLLSSGLLAMATFVGSVRGVQDKVVLAVLARGDDIPRRDAIHFEQVKGGT